jgi:hypothetical protein
VTEPPNVQPIWSGSGSGVVIDFTGAGAFFPHWFEFLRLAADARDRARHTAENGDGQQPTDALTTILFSALATEALINELGEMTARAVIHMDPSTPGRNTIADLATMLDMTEKAQGQIDLKYQLASKILVGKTFPRGQAPFQDFANLITLRNELANPRHRDKTTSAGHVEPASRVVRDLQQRGLTTSRGRRAGDVPGGMSWLEEIKSSGVAGWAYNSARQIILAVHTMLPDGGHLTPHFKSRIEEIPN